MPLLFLFHLTPVPPVCKAHRPDADDRTDTSRPVPPGDEAMPGKAPAGAAGLEVDALWAMLGRAADPAPASASRPSDPAPDDD